jgi:hypothetical protein
VADATDSAIPRARAPIPTNSPATIGSYTAPAALPPGERAARFPRGDLAKARDGNKRGLEKRLAGDDALARAAYTEALAASPAFNAARYNLACELARSKAPEDHTAAIGHLEDLLRVGTAESRAFVARARFAPDFDALTADPRFQAIIGSVRIDPAEPLGLQLCDDPGRVASLIDTTRGLVAHVEAEATPTGGKAILETRTVTRKEALDVVAELTKRFTESACTLEPGLEKRKSLLEYRLAQAGAKDSVCLAWDTDIEWAEQFFVCLSKQPEGWRLATIARFPTGPLDESYEAKVWSRVSKARDEGLALFGKTSAEE